MLQEPDLIIGVKDGKIRLQSDQFGMPAKQPGAKRVKGAKPDLFSHRPDDRGHPLAHLAGRFVGEGYRQHRPWLGGAASQQISNPSGQHPGLAGTRPGQHQDRAVLNLNRPALHRIESS